MNPIERRDFLKGTATGLLTFTVGGVEVLLSAREARAQGVPFRLLTADEAQTIEVIGRDARPRGARGRHRSFCRSAAFGSARRSLLEARILNVRPPYANFYRAALGAVDNASQSLNGSRKFAQLSPSEQHDFVDAMRQNKIQGWQGPGASFVYLVLRCDAVDVVYGTMEGYEALGIPYMPHITPEKRW